MMRQQALKQTLVSTETDVTVIALHLIASMAKYIAELEARIEEIDQRTIGLRRMGPK